MALVGSQACRAAPVSNNISLARDKKAITKMLTVKKKKMVKKRETRISRRSSMMNMATRSLRSRSRHTCVLNRKSSMPRETMRKKEVTRVVNMATEKNNKMTINKSMSDRHQAVITKSFYF